jgi:hypothetical protein
MERCATMRSHASLKFLSVPTEKDWRNYKSDLDQNHAHSVFAGRTNLEAQELIRSSPIERSEDLRWMPVVPFRYYVMGFRDLLAANDFEELDAPDAASCFLRLVIQKLEKQPQYILPIMPELLPAIEHVARNQSLFRANESIYGNFLELLTRIQALYETHRSS